MGRFAEDITTELSENRPKAFAFFSMLRELGKTFILKSDFQELCGQCPGELKHFKSLSKYTQEMTFRDPFIHLMIRNNIGIWSYLTINANDFTAYESDASSYLLVKEQIVTGSSDSDYMLELDFSPFNRDFPKMKEIKSIGKGVEFLNRMLSGRMFANGNDGAGQLLEFMRLHKCSDSQLLIDKSIGTVKELKRSLHDGAAFIAEQPDEAQWIDVSQTLSGFGFRPGWGRYARDIESMFNLLLDILEAPDHVTLEKFLSNIPMIFDIALMSPHGFFGQEKVLGLPDTGGQVVYILDKVKALEKEMKHQIYMQGLDIVPKIVIITRLIPECGETTCAQREEKVYGTDNVWILRVPFRYENGEIVRHWISRFSVWPYMERFSSEAAGEIVSFFKKRPDLIIGNYSDGSLSAYLIAKKLHITHCNIAHALEKAKYLFSDLYWKDNSEYNFSVQYTADLISMNSADFIITSTYQEIAGTKESMGQYESYSDYTLPDLYRVVNGINVFDPKFNIVSPGADDMFYFPYTERDKRLFDAHAELERLIYGDPDEKSRGKIEKGEKRLIFTMARLDKVKNITGLVRAFGADQELRDKANLVVIAGNTDINSSSDEEERNQISQMHQLFDTYGLDSGVRWLGVHLNKSVAGELYRYIAENGGVFVQPAIFEAFGLTVIEAMVSGLPVFATKYGGPLEIIDNGRCGYHINPNDEEEMSGIILKFFKNCEKDPELWNRVSEAAIDRVKERYTWDIYVKKLLKLSRVYGFWKYVSNLDREETGRYIDMFYGTVYRSLVNDMKNSGA
ncbi:MAG: sucrose synthase [Deferribacterales bacterium]